MLAPPPPCVTFRRVVAPLRGPWTVTRSSLRVLRRVAAFCRPLRPVLLLVSFPRSRSPVVGVLGLCGMWRDVPFACQRRPVVGVLGVVLVVAGVVCLCLLSTRLCPQAVRSLPRCVSACVRPRCPAPPRAVPTVHHMSLSPSRLVAPPPPPAPYACPWRWPRGSALAGKSALQNVGSQQTTAPGASQLLRAATDAGPQNRVGCARHAMRATAQHPRHKDAKDQSNRCTRLERHGNVVDHCAVTLWHWDPKAHPMSRTQQLLPATHMCFAQSHLRACGTNTQRPAIGTTWCCFPQDRPGAAGSCAQRSASAAAVAGAAARSCHSAKQGPSLILNPRLVLPHHTVPSPIRLWAPFVPLHHPAQSVFVARARQPDHPLCKHHQHCVFGVLMCLRQYRSQPRHSGSHWILPAFGNDQPTLIES